MNVLLLGSPRSRVPKNKEGKTSENERCSSYNKVLPPEIFGSENRAKGRTDDSLGCLTHPGGSGYSPS